jgi:hypothetical protein
VSTSTGGAATETWVVEDVDRGPLQKGVLPPPATPSGPNTAFAAQSFVTVKATS